MGVASAGRGFGSTFFFALPVYGSDFSPPNDDQLLLQLQQGGSRPFPTPLESLPLNHHQMPLPNNSSQALPYNALASSEIDIGAVHNGADYVSDWGMMKNSQWLYFDIR
jgi:hypothetical protein